MSTTEKLPAYLFESNPPGEDIWISRLFHNRAPELRAAMALLGASTTLPKIHVIHGLRRTGKSHLAKKLLLDLRERGLHYLTFDANANNQGKARAVLVELFCQLWTRIREQDPDTLPDGTHGIYEQALLYLGEVEPLATEQDKDVSFERTTSAGQGHGVEIKFSAPALPGFQIGASGKAELKDEYKKRWSVAGPTDRDLIEFLRYEIDLLALINPGKKLLLLIDDLDLLDRASDDGTRESDALIALMKVLAENRNVLILATIRHAFFNGREKDFKDFVKVGLLKQQDLVSIYRLHIDCFNAGERAFDDQALAWLVRSAEGKAGIFLHRCMELWRRFQPSADAPISVKDVKEFIREELEELRHDSQHIQVLRPIVAAVRDGKREVEIPGIADSGLLYRVLTPVTDRDDVYSINSLYFEVLQEDVANRARVP